MKLNLGSGFHKPEGFTNVDKQENVECDVKLDLSKETWPWENDSVDEVLFRHSLEEMGETRDELHHVFKELFRVCKNEAKVTVVTPHPRHDEFVMNPDCRWPISPMYLSTFSLQVNLDQIANGHHYTCHAIALGVNFEIEGQQLLIDPVFQEDIEKGVIPEEELRKMIQFSNNICQGFEIILSVKKDVK